MAAPLPPHAAPGKVLAGKYALSSILGRGGMGVVMEARHLGLGKRVAVKLLLSEADANTRARFQLEARAAALIASPHVAQVLDFGFTEEGLAYLVMEYLEGCDLSAERKRRGRLPIAEAVDVVLEAMIGIAQAHRIGLVHRDIKPANIFLSMSGGQRTIKVLDFGLIKVLDDGAALTNSTDTFGTPKYMAPEQLRASRDVDERADQHALACVLFELITGRAPFEGESVADIIVKVCTEPAPLMWSMGVSVPQPLDDALQRALTKTPGERFPSIAELAFAIAPFGGERANDRAEAIASALAAVTNDERASAATFAETRRALMENPLTPSVSTRGGDENPTKELGGATTSGGLPTQGPVSGSLSAPISVSGSLLQTASETGYGRRQVGDPTAMLNPSVRIEVSNGPGGTLTSGSLAAARAEEAPPRQSKAMLALAALAGSGIAVTLFVLFVRHSNEATRYSDAATGQKVVQTMPSTVTLAPSASVASAEPAPSTMPSASASSPAVALSALPSVKQAAGPATHLTAGPHPTPSAPPSAHPPEQHPPEQHPPGPCTGLNCL